MHKTGSSAIQETLARGMRGPRWSYVLLGRPNGSLAVRQAFDETFARGPRRPKVRERGLRTFEGAFAAVATPRAVLSAESLSSLGAADLREAYACFARHARSIRAIGYVRPTKSYFDSAFQEILKTRMPGRDAFRIDYKAMFARFDATFGRENVSLVKYANGSLRDGCVVTDFCERTGADFDGEPVAGVNERLSREAVSLLYIYRSRQAVAGEGDKRIVSALGHLPGDKFAFHSSLYRKLSAVGRLQIDAVSQRIGEPFDEDITVQDDVAITTLDALATPSAAALDWLAERVDAAPGALKGDSDSIVEAVAALAREG